MKEGISKKEYYKEKFEQERLEDLMAEVMEEIEEAHREDMYFAK